MGSPVHFRDSSLCKRFFAITGATTPQGYNRTYHGSSSASVFGSVSLFSWVILRPRGPQRGASKAGTRPAYQRRVHVVLVNAGPYCFRVLLLCSFERRLCPINFPGIRIPLFVSTNSTDRVGPYYFGNFVRLVSRFGDVRESAQPGVDLRVFSLHTVGYHRLIRHLFRSTLRYSPPSNVCHHGCFPPNVVTGRQSAVHDEGTGASLIRVASRYVRSFRLLRLFFKEGPWGDLVRGLRRHVIHLVECGWRPKAREWRQARRFPIPFRLVQHVAAVVVTIGQDVVPLAAAAVAYDERAGGINIQAFQTMRRRSFVVDRVVRCFYNSSSRSSSSCS